MMSEEGRPSDGTRHRHTTQHRTGSNHCQALSRDDIRSEKRAMANTTTTTMNGGGKQRHAASAATNPRDLDDVEFGKNLEFGKNEIFEYDSDTDKKDDDYVQGRRSAQFLASDLSGPLSRRIVRFVATSRPTSLTVSILSRMASNPSLPDRRTSECLTVAAARILPSLTVLLVVPLLIWDDHPADWGLFNLYPIIRHVDMVWSSLLHTSAWPIVIATFVVAALMPQGGIRSAQLPQKSGASIVDRLATLASSLAANVTQTGWKTRVALSLIFSSIVVVNMVLHMGVPHALWNPFIWGWYRVYLPNDISPALDSACLDVERNGASRRPLCLLEREWNELSSGQLSSYNPDDVLAVQRGLDYLQHQSGGIIINALARNVVDGIPALKQNVEGLVPFFKDSQDKLSVVIFENDSDDGTREALQTWAGEESTREEPRYTVDLISCGPKNPNCELGLMDRYDTNLVTNPKASGVGKLGEFRQILLEYVTRQERYEEYSHMIVLDADLGTSLSPLGLLHTLGLENDVALGHPVASSSSQVWPGSSGTIIPPYDLSAFRPKETDANRRVRRMHRSFCDLSLPGDRWRNMCEACSPMQLYLAWSAGDPTRQGGRPYEVVSAFNGLTLYPMDVIRQRGNLARYDLGDDGQRCEHVGFHLSLDTPVYVNPKWSMNLKPNRPGGPTGFKAIKTLATAIVGRPNVMFAIVIGNFLFFYIVVYACWMMATGLKLIASLW